MRIRKIAVLYVVFGMMAGCRYDDKSEQDATGCLPVPEVGWRQGDFTGRLYRKLAKGDGNLVFSPYGVGSVCALMATGAKGKTLDAFVKTLGLPTSNPDEIAHVFGCEKRRLGGTVELSDSIWLFNGFKPCDEFRSRAVKVFLAEARKTVGGYAAMREINDYVNKKTHGKIPQPLQSPPSKDTAMAAVDTVYLKAIWEQPFQPAKTCVKKFTTMSGKCVEVPFMDDDIFCAGYYKTNGLAVLALPYRDCGLEMMFLLPDKNVALSRIEALLSESFINEIVPRLLHKGDTYPIGKAEPCPDKDGEYFIVVEEYGGASVCIPKFEFEVRHDLREALDSMGLGIAFAQKLADFSGITPSPGLGLSDVGQVAKIKVDEVGTEAGAGTAALYVGCVMPDFVADRPFIFLLRDAKSGSIFFAGRVTDPSMK